MSYPRHMVVYHGAEPENTAKLIYSVSRTVLVVCSLILSIFGIPGNILAIRILRRRLMRDNALSSYLIWLAAVNICCLLIEMSRYLTMGLFDYNYRQYSYEVCIIHRWCTIVVITVCNWFLVIITLGRWLLLRYPVRSAVLLKQWKVHVMIVAAIFCIGFAQGFLLLFRFNFDFMGSPEARRYFKQFSCRVHAASTASMAIRIFTGVIPLVLLTFISFLIFYQVKQGSRSSSLYLPSAALKRRAVRERNLAILLLIANMQFIVTNLPLGIYYYLTVYKFFNETSRVGKAISELAAHVARMSLYGGYATNCIIYCFFGSRFRSEMIKFLYENGICRQQIRRGSELLVFGTQTIKDGYTTPVPSQKPVSVDATESSRLPQSETTDNMTINHRFTPGTSASDDVCLAMHRRMSTVDPVKIESR